MNDHSTMRSEHRGPGREVAVALKNFETRKMRGDDRRPHETMPSCSFALPCPIISPVRSFA
jgi:hypothetical protein